MILPCFCETDRYGKGGGAEYQDDRYRKGRRVHNKAVGAMDVVVWGYTICGREKDLAKKVRIKEGA